jgi:hypothetical protein
MQQGWDAWSIVARRTPQPLETLLALKAFRKEME